MKMIYVFIGIFVMISPNVFAQTLWNGQGHIPQGSQVDWTNAGLLPNTPTQADTVLDVTDYGAVPNDGQNDFNAIQQAISEARNTSGLSIIYFPPGTYDIHSRIELTHLDNNIVFQGAGSNQTTLKFTVGHTTQCFYIHGYQTGTIINLDQSISKGSQNLYGNGMNNFQTGDWIRLSEYNYPVHNSSLNPFTSNWAHGCVGQISQIESVQQANHAIMKDKASKNYSVAWFLRVYKIIPVQNVGIEKLRIYRNDSGNSSDGTNIWFRYAVNCWVKGVESEYTSRHHIDIWYSTHIYVSGCYLHKARDYGADGRAYGVVLNFSTTNCLIENNLFRYLRHAMLVQAGANCNVFSHNYSRETHWTGSIPPPFSWLLGTILGKAHDIALHGNYPYANLFEQNNVELIGADGSHGNNGPYNAFIRNVVYDDPNNMWYVLSLDNAPNSSVLGNLIWWPDDCPFQAFGNTSTDVDLYGRAIYTSPPNNTYETGLPVSHCLQWLSSIFTWSNCWLNDVSYYYSARPDFLDVSYTNYTWPSCGPGVYPTGVFPTQSVPARGRWFNTPIKTYISDPTEWPPQPPPPLSVTITGPTQLNPGQTGEFTANPSGGSGTYTNYRWWERNDEGTIYALGGITPHAPPPEVWLYISSAEGQQTIQRGHPWSFSLKCEVTDSDNNIDTDIHSVTVGSSLNLSAGQGDGEVSSLQNSSANIIPENQTLENNYPNPFNPTTTIRFGLPVAQQVSIKIYSITGSTVKTLADDYLSEGYHQVIWDGLNESGNKVASGIYIYEMRTKDKRFIKKMLLAK